MVTQNFFLKTIALSNLKFLLLVKIRHFKQKKIFRKKFIIKIKLFLMKTHFTIIKANFHSLKIHIF